MIYKNDKFEITGSAMEIIEFLNCKCTKTKTQNQGYWFERAKELADSNNKLRYHQDKLIERLNKQLKEIDDLKELLKSNKQTLDSSDIVDAILEEYHAKNE